MYDKAKLFLIYLIVLFSIVVVHTVSHACTTDHTPLESFTGLGTEMVSKSVNTRGSKIKTGVVAALVKDSKNSVYEILTDYSKYHEFLPFITESTTLSSGLDVSRVKIKAKILRGTVSVKALVAAKKCEHQIANSVDVSLISGNVKRLDISFTVVSRTPELSVLVVSFMVDPDLWFVTNNKLSQYNQINARRTLRSFRKYLKGRES